VSAAAPSHRESPRAPFAARFESIGATLPQQRLSTKDLMARVKTRGRVDLEGHTGIRERRVCAEGEDSYTLSVDAAKECLRYSAHEAADLEMIICCSISKFKDGLNFVYEPPLSLYVKEAIGAKKALAFDVANACAGMLTGVFIMNDFVRRGIITRGMVISGEYITSLSENAVPHVKSVLSGQLASLSLGDCGAAVIVERSGPDQAGLTTAGFVTLAKFSDLCVGGACEDAPGGEMTTDARRIHQAAISGSLQILERTLEEWGLDYGEIDYLIPHQTSASAIASGGKRFSKHLHATPREVVVNLEAYGNTASTSHFLAMYGLLKEGRIQPGENVVLMALASGIVLGVVGFTMDELAARYG
jgi:3-oxoacyl-[acyl-carrier-protein] synthase-3